MANAYRRYETVIDRYRSGYYPKRLPYDYDFFKAQGELMETLGEIEAARKAIVRDARDLRAGLDREIRSRKNRALTDLIAAGYETRQNIETARDEAINNISSFTKDVRDEIDNFKDDFRMQMQETADGLWEFLDRYL